MERPKPRPVCTCCGGCIKTDGSMYCTKKPKGHLLIIWILSIFIICSFIYLFTFGGLG